VANDSHNLLASAAQMYDLDRLDHREMVERETPSNRPISRLLKSSRELARRFRGTFPSKPPNSPVILRRRQHIEAPQLTMSSRGASLVVLTFSDISRPGRTTALEAA
jgi:hypothetical protein